MNEYLKLTNISFQHQGGLSATDEFFCVYLDQLFRKEKKNILLVTNSLYEANKLYSNLTVLNKDVVLFPMDDFLTSEAVAISPDLEINRLETLNEILLGKKVVVTNLTGYLRFLPTPANYKKSFLDLNVGDIIYSNKYTPMFKVIYDDVKEHDLIHPCCRPEMYDFFYHNGKEHPNCLDNINGALGTTHPIIRPINLFMFTKINSDGSIKVCNPLSQANDRIILEALNDVILGISACSVSESSCNSGKCTAVEIIIK